MAKNKSELPNIFEYDNFRKFVEDTFFAKKSTNEKFSLRFFARQAGFKSHNFIKHVISGKSNLSLASIEKFAKGFKFNQEQTHYFRNLVLLNQSKSNVEKQVYAKELLKSRTHRKIYPLRESQYQLFANWYVSAIRDFVGLPGFQEDPKWIASHLIPQIKPQEAAKAIEDLLNLGLLRRDENNRLAQAAANVTTPEEVSSVYVSNWHKEYIKKAAESIDHIPREKRDITALSFVISRENIKKLKEMASEFRQEVEMLSADSANRDMLYQLNIQIFPIGDVEGGDEK